MTARELHNLLLNAHYKQLILNITIYSKLPYNCYAGIQYSQPTATNKKKFSNFEKKVNLECSSTDSASCISVSFNILTTTHCFHSDMSTRANVITHNLSMTNCHLIPIE